MEKNILKRIFFDEHNHWNQFLLKHENKVRPIVVKEVEKFKGCGKVVNGFKLFVCEGCHDLKKVAYRCKGRFCTTCSVGESEEWSRLISHDMFQVNHRHVIFTVDEGLREVFLLHRRLLKPMMDEAAKLLRDYFYKKTKVIPGIISGLHTFGSRVNFNPHVHMLVTMGGINAQGEYVKYDFLPFGMLRKQWQTVVLKLIRKNLNPREKKQVQSRLQAAYQNNGKGFYIHAPKQKGKIEEQLRYIGRYMRRPAIGLNRIEAYDGQSVTFTYKDKTNGQQKKETISVEEFISRLIRHIPDEQFKTIRHYGMYSRKTKGDTRKLLTEWQKEVKKWIVRIGSKLKRRNWREKFLAAKQPDPLRCPKCDNCYIYKGEVCLQEGVLTIRVALCDNTRNYLERVIRHFTSQQTTQKEKQKQTNYYQGTSNIRMSTV
ncbi:transposase [Psychrobacillus glaciei]|uniref:Transposase n=1 Tax=Psychrobacillus glaciei TaxID=2283160 RepID=A0A5J6SPH3_9BACI|nr:transposase [Psychrobacillus glaciei]QFF98040.1 transposase [Psychrobacillus glaciei]QFF99619.1 transposase [Psychrobacillus glaciei]QFG01025.1 transposase [Psychrobacillus glaciei]